MRILALDYGEKRMGVAVSDPLGISAQGVCTIKREGKKKDVKAVMRIMREKGAEKVVIGLPVRLGGGEGTICGKVKKFGRALEAACGLPVEYCDESLTTVEAEKVLQKAKVSREKRKMVVDMMAAQLILQKYLKAQESRRKNPP